MSFVERTQNWGLLRTRVLLEIKGFSVANCIFKRSSFPRWQLEARKWFQFRLTGREQETTSNRGICKFSILFKFAKLQPILQKSLIVNNFNSSGGARHHHQCVNLLLCHNFWLDIHKYTNIQITELYLFSICWLASFRQPHFRPILSSFSATLENYVMVRFSSAIPLRFRFRLRSRWTSSGFKNIWTKGFRFWIKTDTTTFLLCLSYLQTDPILLPSERLKQKCYY